MTRPTYAWIVPLNAADPAAAPVLPIVHRIPRRLMSGRWPLRRGDGYPLLEQLRKPPIGGYDPWAPRSPPATE